ncbi:ribonuclease P protein subunit p40 [Galendromus occidentalis]|uniref:Ribonuclease P protein subunit p40 n=1 Tax=Galendromus occidentalis TaxID=34638 RepID=A0AAJ7P9J6_9ACAR|nr:ribonuclease P protein subunit p40 [Galendromus occidentalis]
MFPELGDLKNQVLFHSSSGRSYLDGLINDRNFTHVLQLIIPGATSIPANLKEIIKPYYLLRRLRLAEILNFDFICAFIKNGSLSVITAYSPDKGNSMAITPSGVLILTLRSDLYHRLGINGSEVNPLPRKRGFNLDLKKVEVNLRDPKFYPGSKVYDRVLDCASRCDLKYDVLLSWEPPTPEISPFSPMQFLIERVTDLEWKKCSCRFNYQQSFNIDVPNDFDQSFFDWTGVISAGGDMNIRDSNAQMNVIAAQWAGFIPRASLQALAVAARRLVPDAPFVVISSIAFRSDPTVTTLASFNNDSTLTICFNNPSTYVVYSCPPL